MSVVINRIIHNLLKVLKTSIENNFLNDYYTKYSNLGIYCLLLIRVIGQPINRLLDFGCLYYYTASRDA